MNVQNFKHQFIQPRVGLAKIGSPSKPDLLFGIRKKPGTFRLRVVLFCSAMLLASPATGQSETNRKLAPQDTIELHVSYTLSGRYLEAMLVNNTFTIDAAGALYLPMIGVFPASGLREDELAKRINDRLQAMSGLREPAVTFVRRMQIPSSRTSGSAERPRNGPNQPTLIVPGANEPAGAQSSVNGSGMPPVATTQQPLERTKADAMQRGSPPALMELQRAERLAATSTEAVQETKAASRTQQAAEVLANKQSELATRERAKGVVLEQELLAARREIDALKGSAQTIAAAREEARRALVAARADLAAARAQAEQEASAASRARQAAEVLANKQSELATRERAKGVVLEQELLAARREIDALKGSAQTIAAAREEARRALAAVQPELDAARRVARDGSAQAEQEASAASRARQAAKVLANKQSELATRERAKGVVLEQELLAARREIDALKGSAQTIAAAREEARRALVAARADLAAARAQAEQEASAASRARQAAEVLANKQSELATRERAKGVVLEQELLAARREIDALKGSAQTTAAAREEARRALVAARADLAAARAQAEQEASAASRARQAAEVLANKQSELATRERAKGVVLEQELLAARREIDALKGSAQTTAAAREEARRALAAVQPELDAARRVARDGSAQERAIEGQRQIADELVRELATVKREVESLKAKAPVAIPATSADVKAGLAANAALADARRVIGQERQKAGMLERELAAARQSLTALGATADQAAAAEATAMRDLKAAEAATKRLSEALLLQRQKADEAAGELKTARQERDAAKQEAIQVATQREDEEGKTISLARELAAARKEIDTLKSRGQRRIARVENAPKASATMGASASVGIRSKPRSGRKSELREVRKTEVRRSSRSVVLPLPARLLPTRPPM